MMILLLTNGSGCGSFFSTGKFIMYGGTKVSFISTAMTGQFISSFTVAFVGGFILAFPYVFWEFWRFVRPALNPKELKKTRGVIFWVSLYVFLASRLDIMF
jgi:sec-independent protein translocase protein TatC